MKATITTISAAVIIVVRPFAALLYALIKLVRPVKHKVTFISRQSDVLPVDFSMMRADLTAQDRSLRITTLCCSDAKRGGVFGHVRKVLTELWHLANSEAVVLDGYSVAVSYFPQRRGLFVLQAWHALGALKRFSYQALDTPGGRSSKIARALRMHANYSALLVAGEGSRLIFNHAFHVPRTRIRVCPLPRVDLLRAPDPNRAEGLMRTYPELLAARPLVLYAPTFRDTPESYERWLRKLERLKTAAVTRGATLVVKSHFRTNPEILQKSASSAADAPGSVIINPPLETMDLLALCDQVVTDYSAVSFEAACAGKPLWFFTYDINDYAATRGLNIDPRDEMPDACFEDADELMDALLKTGLPSVDQQAFLKRYVELPQVPAAKLITRIILEGIH
jgi:CDP-ribitol ribitolphosphotransferase